MMRKLWFALVAGALAGCQNMEPDTPIGSFELAGSYQAVADCSFVELRKDGGRMWDKDDLPSQNKSQITFGLNETTVGRIEFVGIAPNRTRVDVLFAQKFHLDRIRKQLAVCAV